jgi:uncharacterized Tic20 family protein
LGHRIERGHIDVFTYRSSAKRFSMIATLGQWLSEPGLLVPFATTIGPFLLWVTLVARRILKDRAQYAIEAALYTVSRTLTHSVAATATLKRYSRVALSDQHLAHVHIPSRRDISLPIDAVFVPLKLESAASKQRYDHNSLAELGTRISGDRGSRVGEIDICEESISGLLQASTLRASPSPFAHFS